MNLKLEWKLVLEAQPLPSVHPQGSLCEGQNGPQRRRRPDSPPLACAAACSGWEFSSRKFADTLSSQQASYSCCDCGISLPNVSSQAKKTLAVYVVKEFEARQVALTWAWGHGRFQRRSYGLEVGRDPSASRCVPRVGRWARSRGTGCVLL